jgi:serine/threonine-protein kinase
MAAAPESARMGSVLGDRVRDYEIWGRLGEGGMGQVFLAKHSVLCIPVIIKTVRPELQLDSNGAMRVLQEAKLMARIPSPRVVRAIDAGLHEGRPFLVQEYVDGIDVAELDRRRRSALGVGLPLWFVCEAMHAACEGLTAAHQTGIVHRDVKPSNLFGSPQTGIRLGDFGIAMKQAHASREVSGTIRFMPPEQIRGADVDRAADVWGAGATAFDLRYGRAPFMTAAEVLDFDLAPPFPPAKSPAEAYFQELLGAMLEKDVARRPQNLVDAMRHFAAITAMLRPRNRRTQFVYMDRHTFQVDDCVIHFRMGDLVDAEADAIVSSANHHMKMRSGVGDALRKRGGAIIEEEAIAAGPQPLGTCLATSAGDLHAKHVLHAVSAWNETSCVGRATQRALLLADELGHKKLAVAALGTGAARVTMETCASAMMTALKLHIVLGGTRLRRVEVVLWDKKDLDVYREVAEECLRGDGEMPSVDIGLPAEEVAPRPDAATCIDASKTGG